MKTLRLLFFLAVLSFYSTISAQQTTVNNKPAANAQTFQAPPGKQIYIPEDLKNNDFTNPESNWSYARMAYTDNIVVFWEKGFGNDLSNPPQLEGHDMSVDLDNLLQKLEQFYCFYRDQLKFVLPGSKSEQYRMMVMLNYSLEGTAYGGDYDNTIGALWIAPNRVKDKTLNCIAHELGHSFQSQVMADGAGQAWGGGGIFEMASQWMLWNVNPNWVSDENYHWQAFRKSFHKRFLDGENIYRSPYVLEYWAMKHGITVIGDLFREGKRGEAPAATYMRMFSLDAEAMAKEMYDCYARLITFDFPRVKTSHKKHACQLLTVAVNSLTENKKKSFTLKPEKKFLPETYGFNVIELPLNKKTTTVFFKGEPDNPETDAYRYGIVLVDNDMNPTYLPDSGKLQGKLKYKAAPNTAHVYLVVVGCPKSTYSPYTFNPYSRDKRDTPKVYPYSIIIK